MEHLNVTSSNSTLYSWCAVDTGSATSAHFAGFASINIEVLVCKVLSALWVKL